METILHGMVPHLRVGDALTRAMPLFDTGTVAVIRGIDSARTERDLVRILKFHGIPYRLSNGNVCLSRDELRLALAGQVFTGFDELWVMRGSAPDRDLSALPCATSDAADFAIGVPTEFAQAMVETGCVLALADGCGLNYVALDRRLVEEIAA